jgi:hypothetical protein
MTVRPYRIFTVDINQDGNTDIVMDHKTEDFEDTDTVHYLLGKGDFTFEEPKIFIFPSPIGNLIVGDFNTDGYPDIIASCANTGIVTALNEGLATGSEEETQELVNIFPNPFDDRIEIESDHSTVSIYDIRGILVESASILDKAQLHTGNWQPGVYIVRIGQGKKIIHRKVVKK